MSGPHLPCTPQCFCPTIETVTLDLDGNELMDKENELWEDPMDILNHCKDVIWDACLYTNNTLHLKVRKIMHSQTMEVLTFLKKKVNLSLSEYKTMYLDIFSALISKPIAAKKLDSWVSTPLVTNIKSFMGTNPLILTQTPKPEPEEPEIPLSLWDWTPHSIPNPVVENTGHAEGGPC